MYPEFIIIIQGQIKKNGLNHNLNTLKVAVTWLKYSQYGVKLYPINQSIDQSRLETWNIDRRHWDEIYRTKPFDLDLDLFSQGKNKKNSSNHI